MWHLDLFDAQILAQNVINGADSVSAAGSAVLHAGGRDHERGRLVPAHRQARADRWWGTSAAGWGFVAILAACMLAALSGSAVADTAALAAPAATHDGEGRTRQGARRAG